MIVSDPSIPVEIPGLTLPPLHEKLIREGKCVFRELRIGIANESTFRATWAKNRRAFIERGFTLRNYQGSWFMQQWLLKLPDGRLALTQIGREKVAELNGAAAQQDQMRLVAAPQARALVLPDLPSGIEAKLRGYQIEPTRQIYRALIKGKAEWGYPGAVDFSDMGTGKAQPIDSKVLTPNGWRAIGSLTRGDCVIAVDGKPTEVLGVYPQGLKDVFRVTFTDGTSTRCCDNHLWRVQTPNHRKRNQPGEVKALKDFRNDLKQSGGCKWFVPLTSAVCFERLPSTLPLNPYLLGVLLGDGCLRSGTPRVSLPDAEMVEKVVRVLPEGHSLNLLKGSEFDYSITGQGSANMVASALASFGLMGLKSCDKFIPSVYLYADPDERLLLMQGLFDSDGSASGVSVEYSTSSAHLRDQVRQLVEFHGGTATINTRAAPIYSYNGERRIGLPNYRLRVSLPNDIKPFRLGRKMARLVKRTKYQVKRGILSVEPDGSAECVCISVAHPSRCYLTEHCIVTHNTYMDLAAAIATGRDPAILCPTVGMGGWQRACQHFGITPHFISTYEAVRGAFRPHIATVDATGKFTWKDPGEILLILDEAQALRHDDTLTVRCVSAAIRQGIPIIVASATIAVSPMEMRFAGRVTGLHNGDQDWHRFLTSHGCYPKGKSYKWDGRAHHLTRIHQQLFPWRGARVRKQDLGEECPETIIETLPFNIPEGQEIEREWQNTVEMLERLSQQLGAAEYKRKEQNAHMKMWKRCEMVLVPYLADAIKKDIREGNSVAVFMNFNESRIALSRLLNTTAGFYGGQPLARRQYWEKEFQANRQHVLVSNIGAGGASVSLHDVHGERPRIAYILPTDHVIKLEQATGRVDRVGGKSLSRQYIPFVAGSITARMIERTRRKMRNIATINDGQATTSRF